MYHDVLLDAYKGLPQTMLTGLQRLNILCGPNDSGKTTTLEALCQGATVHWGYSPTKQLGALAAEFAKLQPRESVLTRQSQHSSPGFDAAEWLEILSEVQTSRPIWYGGQVNELFQDIVSTIKKRSRKVEFPNDAVQSLIKNALPGVVPTRLVPAKRRMDTRVDLRDDRAQDGEGRGVLEALAFLKNQRRDSPKFARYCEIQRAFREITGGYHFDITLVGMDTELCISRNDVDWFPANSCGLGFQDILLLLYYCTEADLEVLAIEEPESHLHPEIQRRFLRYLERLERPQVFLSTHSNVFLSSVDARILVTKYQSGKILLADATGRANLLTDLGYSVADNLLADVVVLVEGPTDVPVVQEFLEKLSLSSSAAIRVWPLGGDIMAQLDLEVISGAYRTFALIDRDPKSERVRRIFCGNCEKHGITVTRLEHYSIESYFTMQALSDVFGEQMPEALVAIDTARSLDSQLGFSPKRQNRAIAKRMTFDDIRNTDLGKFFLGIQRELKNWVPPNSGLQQSSA
jgi:predicted ATPase